MSLSATQLRERNNQSLDIPEDERHHEVRELIQKMLAALGGGSGEKERVGLLMTCCCGVDDEAGMGTV